MRRFVTSAITATLALLIATAAGSASGPGRGGAPGAGALGRAVAAPPPVRMMFWADEFEVPGPPNPDYWSHEVNCAGGGNNERQCYTDRLENSFVDENGFLHIVAKEELFSGPALQDDHPDYPGPSATRRYTSARLRTKNKVDWLYGRIEVRAKLPGGQGIWPAVWMLPTNWEYGGWPSSGEVDIVEAVNLARDNFGGWGNTVHGTLHYGLRFPQWENRGRPYFMFENPANDFHEYALEWEEGEIRWYVDGVHYQTQTSDGWYNYIWGGQERGFVVANETAPFDRLFHLIMNVAVGGDWPGTPDSNWNGDREMLVDYVRVYPCTSSSVRGGGTACGQQNNPIPPLQDNGAPGLHSYVIYDDGLESLSFDGSVFGQPMSVENMPVPGAFASAGATVSSEVTTNGAWEIEFARSGPLRQGEFKAVVFLGSADMSDVDGVETGFALNGGSGWSNNGQIDFDLRVESIDPAARLFVKMDSLGTGTGLQEIKIPADGDWHHVAVQIHGLLDHRNPGDSPLDLGNVRNLFVLEGTGPAHLWVDNIRVQCAFNTQPEWWQIDQTCDLRPIATGWIPGSVQAPRPVRMRTHAGGIRRPLVLNLSPRIGPGS